VYAGICFSRPDNRNFCVTDDAKIYKRNRLLNEKQEENMTMKKRRIPALFATLIAVLAAACATAGGGTPYTAPPAARQPPPGPSTGTGGSALEEGIAQIARDIAAALPQGSRVAAVAFASPSERFSGYALDELQGALQNSGRRLVLVERAQLDAVRAELNLQFSGEADEASAVSLGKFLGAQAVIVGGLTLLGGENCRVRFTAIDVETAVRKTSHAVTVGVDPAWNLKQ
jgi:hypothetical protein